MPAYESDPCVQDPISQAEAECLFASFSWILAEYAQGGWDTSASSYTRIACDMVYGSGRGQDWGFDGVSLDAILKEVGCRGVNDNDYDYEKETEGDSMSDYINKALDWVKANPIPAALIAAAIGITLRNR